MREIEALSIRNCSLTSITLCSSVKIFIYFSFLIFFNFPFFPQSDIMDPIAMCIIMLEGDDTRPWPATTVENYPVVTKQTTNFIPASNPSTLIVVRTTEHFTETRDEIFTALA